MAFDNYKCEEPCPQCGQKTVVSEWLVETSSPYIVARHATISGKKASGADNQQGRTRRKSKDDLGKTLCLFGPHSAGIGQVSHVARQRSNQRGSRTEVQRNEEKSSRRCLRRRSAREILLK